MTDIVERLRGMANALGGEDEDFLMEVVAEIERLRATLKALLEDPPPTLDEPDTDAEVIIKMRAIALHALRH